MLALQRPGSASPAKMLLDSTAAFSAAEVASAATAAVLLAHGPSGGWDKIAAKLVAAEAVPDRLAAVHRLNEHFVACSSYEDAMELAGSLAKKQPKLGAALVSLMVDGDALVELVVQLMHNLCLHANGASMIAQAGAFPVLAMALRADEPLLRAHGLSLLVTLSERAELAQPLAKAGVLKLVTFLAKAALPQGESAAAASAALNAKGTGAPTWPPLLEIADGLLRTPSVVPVVQRQQLRDVLAQAAYAHKRGQLPLELHDGRRLTRLLRELRALALTEPNKKPMS